MSDGTEGWKDFQYLDKQLQQSFLKLALALAVARTPMLSHTPTSAKPSANATVVALALTTLRP